MLRFVLLAAIGTGPSWPLMCKAQAQPIDALVRIDLAMQSISEHTHFVKTIMPDGAMTGQVIEGARPPAPMRRAVRLARGEINAMLEKLAAWEQGGLLQICPADTQGTNRLSVTIQYRERPPLAFVCTDAGTKGNRQLEELLGGLMTWVVAGF